MAATTATPCILVTAGDPQLAEAVAASPRAHLARRLAAHGFQTAYVPPRATAA